MPKSFNRDGFTLVELAVVVAILGILTSIAIPRYMLLQHQARRAELPWMVDSIKTAQHAFHAYEDTYIDISAFHPRSTPTRTRTQWTAGSDFDRLDWEPDGAVWGIYRVTSDGQTFTVIGESDTDGDGERARFVSTEIISTFSETGTHIF